MYLYLVSLSTIAYLIALELGKVVNGNFEITYNSPMVRLIGGELLLLNMDYMPSYIDEAYKNGFFFIMSVDNRIKYCNEAKDFAELDVLAPITNAPLKYMKQYNEILVECGTLPISYLYSDRHQAYDGKILIFMWENKFFHYRFQAHLAKSEPILYSRSTRSREITRMETSVDNFIETIKSTSFEKDHFKGIRISDKMSIADFLNIIGSTCFEDQRIKDNRLSRLEENEAIQVCLAAKRHLRQLALKDNAYEVPVFQSGRVELAQIFDFGNEIGDHVALPCPCTPSMYVYFKNPTELYSRDLQIVLVRN